MMPMIKPIGITAALALALGSILGYSLQKLESQPQVKQESGEAIAAIPKQVNLKPQSKRSELEAKYFLCTNSPPNSANLARFDDKALNDLVYQVCTQNS